MATSKPLSQTRTLIPALLSSTAAIAVALALGALVIFISGNDVGAALRALFDGAFGDRRAVGETLVASTPLILGGLAFAVAARAGMFNIGIEGQLVMGSIAAGLVGAWSLGVPAVIHLPLAILAAAVAGGLWGAAPGILKARTGAHEVITTIMLNYLAYRTASYVVTGAAGWLHIVNPELQATLPAQKAARLPNLLDRTRLHSGILLALIAAVILWYLLFQTTLGYRIRTVGLSRGAAAYAGISWGRTITLAMFASGLIGGLAGASEVLGLHGRFYNTLTGYGFTAIAVSLVGRNHPIGVVLSGLLFGALTAGATRMQNSAGVSKEIVQVLQGLVILSVAAFAAAGHLRIGQRLSGLFAGRTPDRPSSDRASAVGMEPDMEASPGPPAV